MSAVQEVARQEAADKRVAQGTLTRLGDGTYKGGYVCPSCQSSVILTGRRVEAAEALTGTHVQLAASACGRRKDGEMRGLFLRVTAPCCGLYQQLDVVVDRSGEFPVAVFLARDAVVVRGAAASKRKRTSR